MFLKHRLVNDSKPKNELVVKGKHGADIICFVLNIREEDDMKALSRRLNDERW